jgi:hypothetical protein
MNALSKAALDLLQATPMINNDPDDSTNNKYCLQLITFSTTIKKTNLPSEESEKLFEFHFLKLRW